MDRYSITLYGTPVVGFTYLLANDAGLVPTKGPGSDYKVTTARGVTVATKGAAVDAALAFVPEGALVAVHEPGTGRVRTCSTKTGGKLVKFGRVSK